MHNGDYTWTKTDGIPIPIVEQYERDIRKIANELWNSAKYTQIKTDIQSDKT